MKGEHLGERASTCLIPKSVPIIVALGDQGRTRESSLRQTKAIMDLLEGQDIVTPRDPGARGGFVSVRVPDAAAIAKALHEKGIVVDHRGDLVRLGPAPYTLDAELERGCDELLRLLA